MQHINLYNDPRANRAAIIASMMSPDMVDDLQYLFNQRGGTVTSDIFAPSSPIATAGIPRPFAILSRAYISDQDFEAVATGIASVFVAQLRTPEQGNDFYQKILKEAFGIPDEIAEPMAKRIETYDPIPKGEGVSGWLDNVGRNVADAGRRFLNWGASLIQMDWEIDQSQSYDMDFLYEVKLLGEAVQELNSRARLMQSQSLIKSSSTMMQFGDPGDDGEFGDAELSRALSPFMLRTLPPQIMGGASNIWKYGLKSAIGTMKAVIDKAGAEVTPQGVVKNSAGTPIHQSPAAMPSFMKMASNPKNLLMDISKRFFHKSPKGDPLYGDVAELYGDAIADSLMSGDIAPFMGEVARDAVMDYSTGDAELDALIDDSMEDEAGDAEMGGPLSRFYRNVQRRKAGRRSRKSIRRKERTMKREQNFLDRRRSKQEADNAGSEEDNYAPQYQQEQPQEESYDDSDEYSSDEESY